MRVRGVGALWTIRVCVGAESSIFTSWGSAPPLSMAVRCLNPLLEDSGGFSGTIQVMMHLGERGLQRALSPLLRDVVPLEMLPATSVPGINDTA